MAARKSFNSINGRIFETEIRMMALIELLVEKTDLKMEDIIEKRKIVREREYNKLLSSFEKDEEQ